MLLPLLYVVLRRGTTSLLVARAWSVILASVLFAVAHDLAPGAPPLCWSVLVIRFAAGVVLSLLFYWRGLGIAVGTHVAYDLLVGLR